MSHRLPAQMGPGGGDGATYGTQAFAEWDAGDITERDLLDVQQPANLWRVAVHGQNVSLTMSYGTGGGRLTLSGLRTPLLVSLPGAVRLVATPIVAPIAKQICRSSASPVGGCCWPVLRQFVDAGAGAVDLVSTAKTAVCLVAGTVTVAGQAVARLAGESMKLIAPSSCTSGVWIVEHEA